MKAATQIVFVTGKGGVGKTTAAAALARWTAGHGRRTLLLETAPDGPVAALFGRPPLGHEPTRLAPGIDGLRVAARQLVEDYFRGVLRFSFLANALLSSSTFNALTAAAPGISEFLLLDRILGIVEPGLGRRAKYDLLVVDGPATGHALRLLRTPRTLLSMVPAGPLSGTSQRLRRLLEDERRTAVVPVSLAEEMSVRETIEMYRVLRDDLGLHVARPVVNRVFPRRFGRADAAAIEAHHGAGAEALVAAAGFAIARRREAERHVAHLRRALGTTPVLFRQLFTPELHADDLAPLGRTIGRALFAEPQRGGRP